LLVKVITVLLRKIDVPQDEIDLLVERIDERGVSEMLAIENYSVQATRREADQQRAEAELRLKNAIKSLLSKGNSIKDVADMMEVTEEYIINLLPELAPA